MKMKKTALTLLAFLLAVALSLSLAACGGTDGDVWEDAIYKDDVTVGEGEITFTLTVAAEGRSVKITVNTDLTNLADALLDSNLISGDEGAYGLYVKTVNGIYADYDSNGAWWKLCKSGTSLSTGVSEAVVSYGDEYEFIYTKA